MKNPLPRLLFLAFLTLGSGASAQIDWPDLTATEIATGATFPVHVTHARDGSGRLFVVEQPGRILVTTSNGFAATPFLDLSAQVSFEFGSEDGLLNLVFPPNFATNPQFYVYYTRTGDLASVVSRFSVSTNVNQADPNSEQQILVIPEVTERSLNGGMLAFGPDGYLYIGTGDNGYFFGIEHEEAQKTSSLWGKILRLDVSSTPTGYVVPPSNPFVGRAGYAPEIWALGLRNPWRFSFDRANGDLYISDVGQFIADEIDYEPAPSAGGKNYGWRTREGRHAFFPSSAGAQSFVDPIVDLPHGPISSLQAAAGGYVYRGPSRPRMDGMYFYSDFYSGVIKGVLRSNGVWLAAPVLESGFLLSSFGEDQSGAIYVTDYISGTLARLDDSGRVRAPEFNPPPPTSDTDSITVTTLSTGGALIRYTTNGVDPVASDPVIASGGTVTITSGATLKARAFRAGLQPSLVTSGDYSLKAARPQFNPAQGPVSNAAPIAVTSATPGAVIRYTLDGSDPDGASTPYATPIPFPAGQQMKARAFRAGFIDSDVALFHSAALSVEKFGLTSFGQPYLIWSSISNQNYQVQFSPDLSYWINTSPILLSTGGTRGFTNTTILPHPHQGFLRVVIP
jgi:glucose/arabinose dehydrogenase